MRRIMLTALVLALAGCQPGGPGSPDELATRYQQAHEAQDLDALRGLVCWDRVDEVTRASVERQIEKELGRSIEAVRVEPLSEGFELEYTLDGVTYRPNLTPVRRIRIEFTMPEKGEPNLSTSMSFLVGERDGTYLITTAAPVADGAG
jgi:hypothetical protein